MAILLLLSALAFVDSGARADTQKGIAEKALIEAAVNAYYDGDLNKSYNLLLRSKWKSNPTALFYLGSIHSLKFSTFYNHAYSIRFFKVAAFRHNDIDAYYRLALMTMSGDTIQNPTAVQVRAKYLRAFDYFVSAVKNEDKIDREKLANAYFLMGKILLLFHGRTKSVVRNGVRYLLKADRLGAPFTATFLGLFLKSTNTSQKTLSAVLNYYKKDANHGLADAQFDLGNLILKLNKDHSERKQGWMWIYLAAEQDLPGAKHKISNYSEMSDKKYVKEIQKMANNWHKEAASNKNSVYSKAIRYCNPKQKFPKSCLFSAVRHHLYCDIPYKREDLSKDLTKSGLYDRCRRFAHDNTIKD